MNVSQASVGFLLAEDPSAEQRAALEWVGAAAASVATVSLADVASGAADPGRFDVLWWHRGRPVGEVPARAATAIDGYLRDGGGLLLSLRALEAVDGLGVDPVPPDATGVDDGGVPAGFLAQAVHADHPAFDGLEGLRVHTTGGEPWPFARYETVLPAGGEVLAATVRGEEDVPGETTLLAWRHGAGAVLGAGAALPFADPHDAAAAGRRRRLVDNLLGHLAGRSPTDGTAATAASDGAGTARSSASPATGRPKSADGLAALRERLADAPHRPRYHLSPPANWLNDPNGLVRWNGRYHVFYQYNPGGPFHNTIHWGHAVSDDLVTWEDRPVALSPSPDGPDRHGCWSGCAVDDDGTPTVLYTGGRDRAQLPCLATAADATLDAWEKADNPIIEAPPPELSIYGDDHWDAEFRDHCVWRDGDTWYQVIGTGLAGEGGAALLYEASDLQEWEYVGPLLGNDSGPEGEVWECPELLDFGDAQLLHVSNYEHVEYFLGDLDLEAAAFRPRRRGRLDYGDFYAPQSLSDPENDRHLTWGWLWPARSPRAQWEAGWSGMLSLPRVLDVGADGRLRQRPAHEVEQLREARLRDRQFELADERRTLAVRGDALELRVDVRFDGAEEFGVVVRESPGGEERTPIRCHPDGEVVVDRSHASLDPEAADDERRMPPVDVSPSAVDPPAVDGKTDGGDPDPPSGGPAETQPGVDDGRLSLRIFLDRSSIEIFQDERRCLTARHYPTRADSDGLSVYADGGAVDVERLTVWRMGSAWD